MHEAPFSALVHRTVGSTHHGGRVGHQSAERLWEKKTWLYFKTCLFFSNHRSQYRLSRYTATPQNGKRTKICGYFFFCHCFFVRRVLYFFLVRTSSFLCVNWLWFQTASQFLWFETLIYFWYLLGKNYFSSEEATTRREMSAASLWGLHSVSSPYAIVGGCIFNVPTHAIVQPRIFA